MHRSLTQRDHALANLVDTRSRRKGDDTIQIVDPTPIRGALLRNDLPRAIPPIDHPEQRVARESREASRTGLFEDWRWGVPSREGWNDWVAALNLIPERVPQPGRIGNCQYGNRLDEFMSVRLQFCQGWNLNLSPSPVTSNDHDRPLRVTLFGLCSNANVSPTPDV